MTVHTLALLSGIFILAHFAASLGIGMADAKNTTASNTVWVLFGLPVTVFISWLLITLLF